MSKATILEDIIAQKHREIAEGRARVSLSELEHMAAQVKDKREFIGSLRQRMLARQPAIIAEIKKASPSKGLIRADFDPVQIARQYEAAGATCLSVLTDRQFFQGCNDYLQQARAACGLPVIRKDFMIDPYQIAEAKALGADCVLLIVAALSAIQLSELAAYAGAVHIDVLVEVHDEAELETALATGFDLIGINNRNLHTFETNLDTTYRLARLTPPGKLLVTESGINSAEDVRQMIEHGIYGFLIGETFMRAAHPGDKLKELFTAHD
ncbi:MAG: indole-3-glycerol phosphate synthase TrpC [Gammaproteobacteria bacterium]|nr:indole-3-glycerol phosphate synthase TrpC [Gammaproteobacteria bacterium]